MKDETSLAKKTAPSKETILPSILANYQLRKIRLNGNAAGNMAGEKLHLFLIWKSEWVR